MWGKKNLFVFEGKKKSSGQNCTLYMQIISLKEMLNIENQTLYKHEDIKKEDLKVDL